MWGFRAAFHLAALLFLLEWLGAGRFWILTVSSIGLLTCSLGALLALARSFVLLATLLGILLFRKALVFSFTAGGRLYKAGSRLSIDPRTCESAAPILSLAYHLPCLQ